MLFNSVEFLIFFPVVTLLFWALADAWRIRMLLLASCLFYMAFVPKYLLILFVVIGIDFVAGHLIASSSGLARRFWLASSLAANIGLLVAFKYFNFASRGMAWLAHGLGVPFPDVVLDWALPLGLSFHTFQAMSYTIEVYRGRQPPERSLLRYALYVLFYPQLVAGPIERPQNLLPQFHEKRRFDYEQVTDGLKLMAWGMFKKVVIADRLAALVNAVYGAPERFDGVGLALATTAFSFQIYCDFSGYSDIALGAAEAMGFRLMTNFRQPYLAQSIGEFWQRWHISLSSWFRDYVYVPLGGNRVGFTRQYANVLVVFSLSGLWHGAAWAFVAWGLLHGVYRVVELALERAGWRLDARLGLDRWPALLRLVRTVRVFVLVSLAWVFFRTGSARGALEILARLGSTTGQNLASQGFPASWLALSAGLIAFLIACELVEERGPVRPRLRALPGPVRWSLYYALILGTLVLGVFERNRFIYFQF